MIRYRHLFLYLHIQEIHNHILNTYWMDNVDKIFNAIVLHSSKDF